MPPVPKVGLQNRRDIAHGAGAKGYSSSEVDVNYDKTREVLEAFEREGVVYAIFGAVALNLHGLARATQDLDIFVSPIEENISKLRSALRSVFDDPHIDEITAEDLLGDYPAVQYLPPETTSQPGSWWSVVM